MRPILNIITKVMSYSDTKGTTNNPQLRHFDWARQYSNITTGKPESDTFQIPPKSQLTVFDHTRPTPLDDTSSLKLTYLDESIYKLEVVAGTYDFRQRRSMVDLVGSECVVEVNNNAVAIFTFSGASFPNTIPGDVLRIAGVATFDPAPFSFNPLNAGIWKVLSVNGNKIQAVRPVGVPFSAQEETVASVGASQVDIYSFDGVQVDDKMSIFGTFSTAIEGTYNIIDVTPDRVYFLSTAPIPEEEAYYDDSFESITFYSKTKKFIYIESSQEAIIRFNNDSGQGNILSPIVAGDPDLVGYLHKSGYCYKLTIVNKSINEATVNIFSA